MNSDSFLTRNLGAPRLGIPAVIVALAILAALNASCMRRSVEVTLFEDVTLQSGLAEYKGMTHGAAWGDYDGDGQPDLYLTNHLQNAMLFRNLGGGRFANVTAEVFNSKDLGGDKHGAAWADFNNDGHLDLVQLTGAVQGSGVEPKRLFVNEGGKLVDRAAELGVDNPPGRTRMPLWIDVDRDGRLDLFHGAEKRFDDLTPPFLFTQQAGRFIDATSLLRPSSGSAPFCVLTLLNEDRYPEVVCRLMGQGRPVQVFDTSTSPARTLNLLPDSAFEDIVAGDFDNDGRIDLFLARKNPGGRVSLAQDGENMLTAQIELTRNDVTEPTAFRFSSHGTLSITVAGQPAGELEPVDVKLGERSGSPKTLEFTLSGDSAIGMPSAPDAARPRVLVGSSVPGQWQIGFRVPSEVFNNNAKARHINVRIQSTEAIKNAQVLGGGAADETAPQRLFMNRDGRLIEESEKRGVNSTAISAVNAVSGDFDNDMDLDIFVLGSVDAGKTPNLLLLNNARGGFDEVRNAGGATGLLAGVGDSVTTADIDGDGFLDILTATGGSMGRSLGLPSDNGRYQLFRNLGNDNNWIEIDLEGTSSNRDGLGAIVSVTANGVTQMRVRDGGVHERGQNHNRIHFGLAKNPRIANIRVQWPSGTTQQLNEVNVNQVLFIKESVR